MITENEIKKWLEKKENGNLEFKSAKSSFDFDHKLCDYCAAIANEEGGKLILGVQDKTRAVIGTNAFLDNWNTLSNSLLQKIGIRVDVDEVFYDGKRLLVFSIPRHLPGQPVISNRQYLCRAGESLVPMDKHSLRAILAEVENDFSTELAPDFTLSDIDDNAFNIMRALWAKHSGRPEYAQYGKERTLRSLGLLTDKGLNYAALILIGKKEKLDSLLPDAEIIFEYRSSRSKVAHEARINWREPFYNIFDDIWGAINARNIRFPFQEGFVQREIFSFHEKVVREVILNAVAHRDYRVRGESIFIKASSEEFFIESPGGLMAGITIDNILYKKAWRNRCIAEVFEKTHLVERSGQGMDDIFEITIKEGKGLPDLSETDSYSVRVKIPAQLKDKNFVLFLEKVANKRQVIFSLEELLELESIRANVGITKVLHKEKFLDLGVIEKVGRTSDSKYILSHNYYEYEERPGIYTRIVGLSRDKTKELILAHLKKNKQGRLDDFKDAFPELKPMDISNILRDLRKEQRIRFVGRGVKGKWVINEDCE